MKLSATSIRKTIFTPHSFAALLLVLNQLIVGVHLSVSQPDVAKIFISQSCHCRQTLASVLQSPGWAHQKSTPHHILIFSNPFSLDFIRGFPSPLYMMTSQCGLIGKYFPHLSSRLRTCWLNIICTLKMKSLLIEMRDADLTIKSTLTRLILNQFLWNLVCYKH